MSSLSINFEIMEWSFVRASERWQNSSLQKRRVRNLSSDMHLVRFWNLEKIRIPQNKASTLQAYDNTGSPRHLVVGFFPQTELMTFEGKPTANQRRHLADKSTIFSLRSSRKRQCFFRLRGGGANNISDPLAAWLVISPSGTARVRIPRII